MNVFVKYRLGALPKLLCLVSLRILLRLGALTLIGAAALSSVLVNAEEPPGRTPPTVTPMDTELDRQNKLRLHEKISYELEENRRRISEQNKQKVKKQHSSDKPASEKSPGK